MTPDLFASKTIYHIIYDDSMLTIAPVPPGLEEVLKYTEKRMEMVQGPRDRFPKKTTRFEKVDMFKYVQTVPYPVLQTYAGLLDRLLAILVRGGMLFQIYDQRQAFPDPRLDLMVGFRCNQRQLLTDFLLKKRNGLLGAPTRYGKCFGKGTPVLMADWTIKPIEEIQTGDVVMGPDSKPRVVGGCARGHSDLFRVTPNYNGMPWVCNDAHELHVQRTCEAPGSAKAGVLENISVSRWMGATKWFRHIRKQRRVVLEHALVPLPIPPYIYGAWLGGGHSEGVTFTNAEPEVWAEIEKWAAQQGLLESQNTQQAGKATTRHWVLGRGTGSVAPGSHKIRQWLRAYKKSAGIRFEFIRASRAQRLELLAGLLDTDGESNGTSNCGFVSKHRKLAEDVVFLCQSLGFGAACQPCWKKAQTGPRRQYWRVGIRGETNEVPFRVARKKRIRENKFNCRTVGFKVEPIGKGDYYGFALEDPEGLFLLGDCTVVHNTTLLINTCRAFPGVPTVVATPGHDLVKQLRDDMVRQLPKRDIVLLGAGSSKKFPSEDITVCSMDSLHKCDHGRTRLLLIDEPHACVTDTRAPQIYKFNQARRLGFGATTTGRYDQRDIWIEALIGPLLVNRTYLEAVEEKAICPLVVYMLKIKFDPFFVCSRDKAYNDLLYRSPRIAELTARICRKLIPADWQTLVFIADELQAEFYLKEVGEEGVIVMAKRMTTKERQKKMDEMQGNIIKRCLASKIYAQGVTFSDSRCLVNVEGGGGSISSVQKPGRLAEIRPGKSCGIIFDFLFECSAPDDDRKKHGNEWWNVVRDSRSRMDVYKAKGYEVHVLDTWAELKEHFDERAHAPT